MTWSRNAPRGGPRETGTSLPAPVSWAPDELALDTSSLHEHFLLPDADASDDGAGGGNATHERAIQDAYTRGLEDGRRAEAGAEGARLRSAVSAVSEALDALQMDSQKWVGNAEENICALAVAIARHVIGKEVVGDQSSLVDVVRKALAEFPLDQTLTLRMHPTDLQVLNTAFRALGDESPLATRQEVQWLPDPRVAPGGCLIEGRDRIVDGRVDTALERVYRRLTYTGA